MKIKRARQILKSLSDDTRLRILNLLRDRRLTVNELCGILDQKQSNISKHLARLRLTGVGEDKRRGNNALYCLSGAGNDTYGMLAKTVIKGLADIDVFKKDRKKMNDVLNDRRKK